MATEGDDAGGEEGEGVRGRRRRRVNGGKEVKKEFWKKRLKMQMQVDVGRLWFGVWRFTLVSIQVIVGPI